MERELQRMAAQVLADVAVWRLRRESWDEVEQGLQAMNDALATGDLAGFRRAVANVEMAGPHRISGLEDSSMLPLPEEHRERLDELVHVLGTDDAVPHSGPAAETARPNASG